MKKIIEDVLEDLTGKQLNFESKTARETISKAIITALKSKGCYTEYDDSEEEQTSRWPGIDAIQKQFGFGELPTGGDTQAVLESHKLADEIVGNQKDKWIYESPDGGKTVFRRPFSDYDPANKKEIDWDTKEPTGRKFTEYNTGLWNTKDEE
jgi:hypothetical protein